MNLMNSLLNEPQREGFISLLMGTMVGRPELSPMGWIIQDEPAEKRLHLEEFVLEADGAKGHRYLMALVARDLTDEIVGCFPVNEELLTLRPAQLRKALLQVCNAPNGSITADKPIHLASPAQGNARSNLEVSPEAQKISFYVSSVLRKKERLGVVVVPTWDAVMQAIQTLRPWMVRFPTHWWERSRRNEVRVNLFPGPGGATIVFVPTGVELRLDRCERPDSCLQLVPQLGSDLTSLLQASRRTVTPAVTVRVLGYQRNVDDAPTTPSSSR